MTDNIASESDEGEIKSDFEEDFQHELRDFPHVLRFIQRMHDHIKKQNKKITKLRNKLNEYKNQKLVQSKNLIDYGTQTNPLEHQKESGVSQNWSTGNDKPSASIVDQVKEAAESALLQTGFVYEETSGLYYDYNSGYYYDAKQGLYYDGNSGRYYYYDETSGTYQFHSQAQVTVNEAASHTQSKKEQKARKATKDEGKKRKLAKREEQSEDNELEEGECSSDDNDSSINDITPELCTSSDSDHEEDQDLAKTYPPCMRIIVKETNLPKLKVGNLFLIAYTGGSIGREGDHSVVIPDINVSKHHARFVYNEEKKMYEIIDLGSRNGTFLNGKRLSVAKQESEPHEVSHCSIVQVGTTKLLCHIHNGNETCGHCEPGLVQQYNNAEENKTSKKDLHKQELRRLKHKFGIEKDNVASASQVATGYQDRAQSRRQCIGSLNHHAKTQQSSVDISIAKDNRGFKLLSKMGWTEGQSLGKEGDGPTEPVRGDETRREEAERGGVEAARHSGGVVNEQSFEPNMLSPCSVEPIFNLSRCGARASASCFPARQTGKPGQTFELAQTVWHPTTAVGEPANSQYVIVPPAPFYLDADDWRRTATVAVSAASFDPRNFLPLASHRENSKVSLTNNPSKTGLGATSEFPTIELDSSTEKKQALWRKTQQRYKEITD